MKNKILLLLLAVLVTITGFRTNANAQNFYIVQKNDTLFSIAKAHNISSNDIILQNKQIINKNFIMPNEIVNVSKDNDKSFGVLYKSAIAKFSKNEVVAVSNFNYDTATKEASENELNLLNSINEIRNANNRTSLSYDKTLSFIAESESSSLLSKDTTDISNNNKMLKKLSFYNTKLNYAGLVSCYGQTDTVQISDLLSKSALDDYVINPNFNKIGLFIYEMNDVLYTSLYFAC